MAAEIKAAIPLEGHTLAAFMAYGNMATLTPLAKQALTDAGVPCTAVKVRRNSADFAITSDAVLFAKKHGSSGCLVVVSSDQGFAQPLQYCRSLGCFVITIGRFRVRDRARPWIWTRLALPQASDIAMRWADAMPAIHQLADIGSLNRSGEHEVWINAGS
ncbi:hypothetical protein WJX72_001180 [[Myrmecia] bisecta]|uniref:NYN domain-containing protein n=1 Tax=[Myrmecia] bisecta TaxID=41462 RepID=A0AAW1R4R1_9CHLO